MNEFEFFRASLAVVNIIENADFESQIFIRMQIKNIFILGCFAMDLTEEILNFRGIHRTAKIPSLRLMAILRF